MDYFYKKAGKIFNAHSYWTKQPEEVIEDFIKKNTSPKEIVLDPFCGSGMTGVASIRTNREFLLSDISPACIHIASGYCNKITNTNKISKTLHTITKDINYLYYTHCPHCNAIVKIDYSILEDKLEKENLLELKQIVAHCTNCKKKIRKQPEIEDYKLYVNDSYKNFYFPQDYFFGNEPKRNYKRGIKQVFQLYSKRNLSALSRLLNNIIKIEEQDVKQFFLFAFTSILFNCSIMSRYNPKYENTQIKMGTYYIPQFIKDNNVVLSFERKVKNILKSNEEIFNNNTYYKGKIQLADATKLTHIKDNSIDYIYTDPPYSDKISYAELNIVYESWLNNERTNIKKEMIVSKADGKDIDIYSTMFNQFFKEAQRILKNNKRLTVIFHNSSIQHWYYFQKSFMVNGLKPIFSEDPIRLVSNAKTSTQYQTKNDSQCFLAFNFEKDTNYIISPLKKLTDECYMKKIEEFREESKLKGFLTKPEQFDYIINRLLFEYEIKDDIKI